MTGSSVVMRVQRHDIHVSRMGDGAPLLLINGLGGAVSTWEPLRQQLPRFHTIAYDAPGSGRSPTSPLPLTVPGMVSLVRALLSELGLRRVDVLGTSMGGLVAQQLAACSPSTVRRLVLMSTNTGWGSLPGHPRTMRHLVSLRRLRDPAFYQEVAPELLGGAMRTDPALVRAVARERAGAGGSLRGHLNQLSACCTWSTLPFLPFISAPTLVINGDDDPLARVVNARLIAGLIPRARLHLLREAGHHLILERPREVAELVTNFLEEDT